MASLGLSEILSFPPCVGVFVVSAKEEERGLGIRSLRSSGSYPSSSSVIKTRTRDGVDDGVNGISVRGEEMVNYSSR